MAAFEQLLHCIVDQLTHQQDQMAVNMSTSFTFCMMFDKDDCSLPDFLYVENVGNIEIPVPTQVWLLTKR